MRCPSDEVTTELYFSDGPGAFDFIQGDNSTSQYVLVPD